MECICVPAEAATLSSSSCSTARRFPWRGIVAFFSLLQREMAVLTKERQSQKEEPAISSVTAAVKTLAPARPIKSLPSTSILFLDRNNPDNFSTRFQEDFQPFPLKKVKPFRPSLSANVDHKDVRHINEILTEAKDSYHYHPLPKLTRLPRWTTLYTNFKMQTDPTEVGFLTTQSQAFCPKPFHPPAPCFWPSQSFKVQQVEAPPESTNKSSFTPHQSSAVVKASAKHLG